MGQLLAHARVLPERSMRGAIIASVKKRLPALLLAALMAAGPVHGYNLPDLGDVAVSDLSHLDEQRIGESIMQEIRWRDPSYLDDVEVEDYVGSVGRRMVAVSPQPDRPFEFFVINDPQINAFA